MPQTLGGCDRTQRKRALFISRRHFIRGASLTSMGFIGSLLGCSATENSQNPVQSFPSQLPRFQFQTITINSRGEIVNRQEKEAQYFQEDLGEGIGLDMVAIPGGEFLMGSPEGEGYDSERPQHRVTIQPFFMGKFEVTQAQWRRVASLPKIKRPLELNPAYFQGDSLPVDRVSWYDCEEFCARLSRYTGYSYRLPSEAEWEYACRAGTTTLSHFGETLTTDLANYDGRPVFGDQPPGEYRQKTTPVGSFYPNGFGLYDMHGNLWEWCADLWHGNYDGAPSDGSVWQDKILWRLELGAGNRGEHMLRGGCWDTVHRYCRSAYRYSFVGTYQIKSHGLRLVCSSAIAFSR